MFYTHDFKITLTMLGKNTYISNKGLLSILQDTAEMHSASIGFGITNINETHKSWALLNWKLHIFERPKYGDTITIKTWSRYSTKLYSYRDFEILNSDGKIVAIATSKWILIDVEQNKVARITEDLINKYQPESKSVFGEIELEDKLALPEKCTNSIGYNIRKADIDINEHVNNLNYIDIALEVFPGEANTFNSCSELEIWYKHQIKFNDIIEANYSLEDGINCVLIKSVDGSVLRSVIRFK